MRIKSFRAYHRQAVNYRIVINELDINYFVISGLATTRPRSSQERTIDCLLFDLFTETSTGRQRASSLPNDELERI